MLKRKTVLAAAICTAFMSSFVSACVVGDSCEGSEYREDMQPVQVDAERQVISKDKRDALDDHKIAKEEHFEKHPKTKKSSEGLGEPRHGCHHDLMGHGNHGDMPPPPPYHGDMPPPQGHYGHMKPSHHQQVEISIKVSNADDPAVAIAPVALENYPNKEQRSVRINEMVKQLPDFEDKRQAKPKILPALIESKDSAPPQLNDFAQAPQKGERPPLPPECEDKDPEDCKPPAGKRPESMGHFEFDGEHMKDGKKPPCSDEETCSPPPHPQQ